MTQPTQANRDAAENLAQDVPNSLPWDWDKVSQAFAAHADRERDAIVALLREYDKPASIVRELAQNIADAIARNAHRSAP